MACNAKTKGKNGELEAAKILNELLPHAKARRSQQFKGDKTAADLTCPGLPNIQFEVKRRQSMNLHTVMKKSLEDCGENDVPVILHRKDSEEWLMTIRLEDLPAAMFNLLREGKFNDG